MYKIWKPEYKSLNNAPQEQFDASNVRQKPTKKGWERRAIKNGLDDMNFADNGDDPRNSLVGANTRPTGRN
jgi:hypothetical protein